MLRALIVEDEPLSRDNLRDYMAGLKWLTCIGEAVNGCQAVSLIDRLRPDLVFLDVRIPEMTGLEVVKAISHDPFIVFTTAYDEYAVNAFDLEAVDYLLKPFSRRRFIKTLERVKQRIGLAPVKSADHLTKIFVRERHEIIPINVQDIVYFRAAANYVEAHQAHRSHLIQLSMAELETRLDPNKFLRIHRSGIVNIDHIQHMETYDDRRLLVKMTGQHHCIASRSGSQKLKQLIL